MSFAFAHQNKTNKTGDSKKSTPPKHSSYPHVTNLHAKDSPNNILHLQRAIGNQAVQRLLRSKNNNVAEREFDFAKIGILQPKLKISQPGDAYEQEADKVGDKVKRMPDSSDSVMPIEATEHEGIARKCTACEMKGGEDEEDLKISRKALDVSDLEANDQVTNEINNARSSSGSPAPSEAALASGFDMVYLQRLDPA
jgi:hypothetical protein